MKLLVQQLSDELDTSMNDLVLRAIQTALSALPTDGASDHVRALVQSLRAALKLSLPMATIDTTSAEGNAAPKEHKAA